MWQIITNNWGSFLTGFWNTILCSIIALIFSLILGVFFALLEVAPTKFGKIVAKVYIAIFRNIPLLVIVMIFYLIVPRYIVKLSGFQAGTIGLTLYTSAFIAETVRAGISSIGTGQMEGARSNGMSYGQAMYHVVMPQALNHMIPALLAQFVSLVKDTSLATIIVLPELLYNAQIIYSQNTTYLIPMYVIIAIMYFVVCFCLSTIANYLQKKYN